MLWWQYTTGIALGGFIALAFSVLVTLWVEKLKQNAERKRLAAIIADELQAIVDYITENDFDSKLTAAAEAMRKGSIPNVAQFSGLRGTFIIASAKIDSPIGIFPERLALQTASLSTLLRGIIQDFTMLREAWRAKYRPVQWQDSEYADFCTALGGRIRESVSKARSLIPELLEEPKQNRNLFY
jgi:predicted outer membrane lipoprotein